MKLPGLKIADKVNKLADKTGDASAASADLDKLRSHAAIAISVLAALLALASAGADNAVQTIVNSNIQASDTWAFYQAKSTRQTLHVAAAETLEAELAVHGAAVPAEVRAKIEESAAMRRATAARYDDEPDENAPADPTKGDGKKQLMARAKAYEAKREHADGQVKSFRFAAIALQIGIVLGSVAILAGSRRVLVGVAVAGAVGVVLLANGYTSVVPL